MVFPLPSSFLLFDSSASKLKYRQQGTHSKEAGFVEIEMELDDNFEGDARELTEGGDVFVSYKYTGSHPNGQPFRPMVYSSSTSYSLVSSIYIHPH